MAYISFQPQDYFNTKLFTGTGSALSVTGVGFAPDLSWVKRRSSTRGHTICDNVRGDGYNIYPELTSAESQATSQFTSLDSDGFTLGTDDRVNQSSGTYVSWNWKAGTTSGITTNSDTSITPSAYSFNQTSGVSIVKFTGTAVDGAYLPHGLGKAPELLFLKQTSGTEPWQVYAEPIGNGGRGWLNTTDAFQTSRGEWYSTNPDSVNMRISNDSHINASGATYICYFFTSIQGFSKIGSYIGNGNADGPFCFTGFKPAFLLAKETSSSGEGWVMFDNKRSPFNLVQKSLQANITQAEEDLTSKSVDFLSNGFKVRTSDGLQNSNGETYIYLAFAEVPFVASNGDATTAR